MEEIISKELLSEVLELNKKITMSVTIIKNIVTWDGDYNCHGQINIYELAHKCKERAVKQGYTLIEYPFVIEIYNEKLVLRCCKIEDKTTILYCQSRVFKACQWILDNKEQQ